MDPTDGDYVPMTRDEIVAMLEARREREVRERVTAAATEGTIDPSWILENLKDPQLSAALTAIEGKLETGEFPQVGQSNADAVIAEQERANLVRAKEQLTEQLARVEEELAGMQPGTMGAADLAPVETVSPEAKAALDAAAGEDVPAAGDAVPAVEEAPAEAAPAE